MALKAQILEWHSPLQFLQRHHQPAAPSRHFEGVISFRFNFFISSGISCASLVPNAEQVQHQCRLFVTTWDEAL